jgi:hypothetical protein
MRKSEGSALTPKVECTNPRLGKWKLRILFTTETVKEGEEERERVTYIEFDYNHKPSLEEFKTDVYECLNQQTQEAIIGGFQWEGMDVWLSEDNQRNYERAYLLAKDNAEALPYPCKFEKDGKEEIYSFTTLEDLAAFVNAFHQHITARVTEGWQAKQEFDFSDYEEALK